MILKQDGIMLKCIIFKIPKDDFKNNKMQLNNNKLANNKHYIVDNMSDDGQNNIIKEEKYTRSFEDEKNLKDMIKEAEAKSKKSGFFLCWINYIFGISYENNDDDIADLYNKAGNKAKSINDRKTSFDCFVKAGNLYQKIEYNNEAAANYEAAASVIMKINPMTSLEYFEKAVDIYIQKGSFYNACNIYKNLAQLFEDQSDYINAIKYTHKLIDIYESNDKDKLIHQYISNLSKYYVMIDEYDSAIDNYNKLLTIKSNDVLYKYKVTYHIFLLILLKLFNDDIVGAKNTLEYFCNYEPYFKKSSEKKWSKKIIKSVETLDQNLLNCTLDKIKCPDDITYKILINIKNKLTHSSSLV